MIVLIAVAEKQIPISDTFNPQPIQGRQSIFNRVAVATETGYQIEIVGAYSTLELAAEARSAYDMNHKGRKYIQKVCKLDSMGVLAATDPVICVRCRKTIPGPESYCPPCQQAQWRDQAAADPMHDAAADPIVRTDVGQHSTIRHDMTPA